MTREVFHRGDWQKVIESHPLESHDAVAWLRYGQALLHSIEPGPEQGKQQRQAGFAFQQAQKWGASNGALIAATRQAVMLNLKEALALASVPYDAGGLERSQRVAIREMNQPGFDEPRRLLLVLGMHRSGTSALAGLLGQAGFVTPVNPEAGDANNPTGYWEPRLLMQFHDRLIAASESSWEDPLLPVLPWLPEPIEPAIEQLEQALAEDFAGIPADGVALVKDPRQCRLMPLWTELLQRRSLVVQVLLVVRRPEAVAASLWRRDQLPLDRSLLLWLSHTLEAELHSRQQPRLVVSYEALLQDPAAVVSTSQRLAGLPEQPLLAEQQDHWIRPELNHAKKPLEEAAAAAAAETQGLLQMATGVYVALCNGAIAAGERQELLDRTRLKLHERLQALLRQGSQRTMMQLFWEPRAGGGFGEEHSQRRSVAVERSKAEVVFMLPETAAMPRALRLDLAEQPGLISLQHLELRGGAGESLWQWCAGDADLPGRGANHQTRVLPEGLVLAGDGDPGVVLAIPAESLERVGTGSCLRVVARWQALPEEVARQVLGACCA